MASRFLGIRQSVREKVGLEPLPTPSEEEVDEENARSHRRIVRALQISKQKFIEKKFVGNVSISTSLAIFSSSISIDIDGLTTTESIVGEDDSSLGETVEASNAFEKLVSSSVDRLIKQMKNQAKSLEALLPSKNLEEEASKILISNGISISDGVGILSLSINFSANLSSILSS